MFANLRYLLRPNTEKSENSRFRKLETHQNVRTAVRKPSIPLNLKYLVPKKGLEPPHPCEYMDLNHARLPIPPLRHFRNPGSSESASMGYNFGAALASRLSTQSSKKIVTAAARNGQSVLRIGSLQRRIRTLPAHRRRLRVIVACHSVSAGGAQCANSHIC